MRRLEIKSYNGQFAHRGVLRRLRRKIERTILQGECVLLDGEGVVGLSQAELRELVLDLPHEKIRVLGFNLFPAIPDGDQASLPGPEKPS